MLCGVLRHGSPADHLAADEEALDVAALLRQLVQADGARVALAELAWIAKAV